MKKMIEARTIKKLSNDLMNANRKYWNEEQKKLRASLTQKVDFKISLNLFIKQHAMLHSAKMAGLGAWSYEDEILEGLTELQIRLHPGNEDHSIAWIVWHITRIEDVTMNLLVAGNKQVLAQENWLEKMNVSISETGNGMTVEEMEILDKSINIRALLAYRVQVGRRTIEIARQLSGDDMNRKIDAERLKRVLQEGAVVESSKSLLDYWGKLTFAGIFLMPPTRHTFIHWNEASGIKNSLLYVIRNHTPK